MADLTSALAESFRSGRHQAGGDATRERQRKLALRDLGGPGSGNFGHAGRPGQEGGSAARKGDELGPDDDPFSQFRPSAREVSAAEANALDQMMLGAVTELVSSSERIETGGLSKAPYSVRGAVKAKLVKDIAARITMSQEELAKIDDTLTAEKLSQQRVDLWADTSGDSDARAVRMQHAIMQEFDLDEAAVGHLGNRDRLVEKFIPADRAFVRAEYENTQAWLKEKGIDYVTLYRGAGMEEERFPGFNEITMQPASSWTTDIKTAMQFAEERHAESNGDLQATIYVSRVPRERILSTALTGRGCLVEHEVLVLGGKMNAHVFQQYDDNEEDEEDYNAMTVQYRQSYKKFAASIKRVVKDIKL